MSEGAVLMQIIKWLSKSDLREPVAKAATKIPNVVKLPIRIEKDLYLLVYPQYEDIRYLAHDKETELQSYLEEHLAAGDTFIDAGAHIGYYSLIAANIVGQSGNVVAFEPHPNNAQRIRENTQINDLDITVEQAAVTGHTGQVTLSAGENTLSHSVSDEGSGDTCSWSLDEYAEEHGLAPDIIKLDVEGSEKDAILGSKSTLSTHQPAVLIEIHPWVDPADAEEIHHILTKYDYKVADTGGSNISRKEVLELYRNPRDGDHLHIIASPK